METPVQFRVANVNRSKLSCSSDGARYTLSAHLTARRALLQATAPTVVLVHDVDHGEWFWRFEPGSGHDFSAALAARGLRVLTIDRLGYAASPHPNGRNTCLGAQADMLHQVIGLIRAGGYRLDGHRAPGARLVGLVADGAASALTELVSYSWPKDADALALMSWSDPGASAPAAIGVVRASAQCAAGGQPNGASLGYASFAPSEAEYRQDFLYGAPPNMQTAVARLREPDPCGDYLSLPQLVGVNLANISRITQPVLLLYGQHDPLLTATAAQQQRQLLSGSRAVSTVTFAHSSGDLTLDGDVAAVQRKTAAWLCTNLTGCKPRARRPLARHHQRRPARHHGQRSHLHKRPLS